MPVWINKYNYSENYHNPFRQDAQLLQNTHYEDYGLNTKSHNIIAQKVEKFLNKDSNGKYKWNWKSWRKYLFQNLQYNGFKWNYFK